MVLMALLATASTLKVGSCSATSLQVPSTAVSNSRLRFFSEYTVAATMCCSKATYSAFPRQSMYILTCYEKAFWHGNLRHSPDVDRNPSTCQMPARQHILNLQIWYTDLALRIQPNLALLYLQEPKHSLAPTKHTSDLHGSDDPKDHHTYFIICAAPCPQQQCNISCVHVVWHGQNNGKRVSRFCPL
eukprot:SAG31_NODE_10591_length_1120_cov_1.435847_2_plen_187_part_00